MYRIKTICKFARSPREMKGERSNENRSPRGETTRIRTDTHRLEAVRTENYGTGCGSGGQLFRLPLVAYPSGLVPVQVERRISGCVPHRIISMSLSCDPKFWESEACLSLCCPISKRTTSGASIFSSQNHQARPSLYAHDFQRVHRFRTSTRSPSLLM